MDITDSPASLFPPSGARLATEHGLTEALLAARARVAQGSVTPTLDMARFKHELAAFDFEKPRALDDVLGWTITQLEHGIVQITHPRYFGLFNPNPTFPAQCADRIANAFNPQLASSKTSPAAVEIEAHVIRAFAHRAGFPADSAGHFTSGGSEANFTAVVCALTRANSGFAKEGARAFDGAPVFYVSRESHLAWIKIAHETGIGRNAARLIATDGQGRTDLLALEAAIKADKREGAVPVMIVATAGTTGGGMLDDLIACGALARKHDIWCHVDAAWGGALLVSERLRHTLAGIELADSITIDAHKWLAATMGCGMFLTRHPALLTEVFEVANSFMPSRVASADPYMNSAQWSRRFMGLRLFCGLAVAGWEGYARHIERSIALSDLAKALLQREGWRILNRSPLAVLCLAPPKPSDPAAIVAEVLRSGRAWISVTDYEGQSVIRACITNGETSREDVEALASALNAAFYRQLSEVAAAS